MQNIFQTEEWKNFKLKTGYQKAYWVDNILVLQKNLPFGFSMLYSPMVTVAESEKLKAKSFLNEIRKIATREKTIFYRLELDTNSLDINLSTFGFIKTFEEMQPEHTLVLDLKRSEEELLSQMKQKGRYNIRVAEKNSLTIKSSTDKEAVSTFYDLYSKTAKRHGITYRAKSYFEGLLEILGESGYARVYTAYRESDGKTPLSSAIMVYSGDTAIYMFGASSDEYKNLMAPYLLHWTMIKEAKEKGFSQYDFFGIAPDNDPDHPWAGVTRFKKQFGGEEIHILGSYDLILKPITYQLFKTAERIRRH